MKKLTDKQKKNVQRLVRAIKTDIKWCWKNGVKFDAKNPSIMILNPRLSEQYINLCSVEDFRKKKCGVCAIGAICLRRKLNKIDSASYYDPEDDVINVVRLFKVSRIIVADIFYGITLDDNRLEEDIGISYGYKIALNVKKWVRKNGYDKRVKL